MTFDRHRGSQGYVPGSQGHAPGSQGGGVGGGYSGHDGYAIGAGFAELAKLVDEAKRLSFLGGGGGGWPRPVERIEKTGARLCEALDKVSAELNALSQSLNRLHADRRAVREEIDAAD